MKTTDKVYQELRRFEEDLTEMFIDQDERLTEKQLRIIQDHRELIEIILTIATMNEEQDRQRKYRDKMEMRGLL